MRVIGGWLLAVLPALGMSLAAPALADQAHGPHVVERVDMIPTGRGTAEWVSVRDNLIGIALSESKYFRVGSDNPLAFRGLGQDNDIVQWFVPSLELRGNLAHILSSSPAAVPELVAFQQGISGASTALVAARYADYGGGLGLLLGASIDGAAKGKGAGAAVGNSLFALALLALGSGLVTEFLVVPPVAYPQFMHLDRSIELYNNNVGWH